MVDAGLAVTLGLNALSAILVLSLIALGLGVTFGLMGVINVAHGAFYALGAYTVWIVGVYLDSSFWLGFALAPLIGAVAGLVTEVVVVSRLYDRLLDSILATWGVALVIGEILRFGFGSTAKQVSNPFPGMVDLGVTSYPLYRLFVMIFAALILVAVFGFVYRTNFGIRLRAVIEDSENAELLGINQKRTYRMTFSFGTALAAMGGAAMTPFITIEPGMGVSVVIESFFAIILGGTGTLVGIIPGSVVVGGLSNTMTFAMQPIVAQTVIYIVVILVMVLRPTGIMGEQR